MPLSMHPVDVGVRSEIAVINELMQLGFDVWTPLNPNTRSDLLIDIGSRVLRVQVKTGRLVRGAVVFSVKSIRINTKGNIRRGYQGEIDYFASYCPALDESFVVPIDECPANFVTLRVEPTANNQGRGVRWAADYRLRDFTPE